MAENGLEQGILIKELEHVNNEIQAISNQNFQMYKIAYIPLLSVLALLVFKSKVISDPSNVESFYGYYFICLLFPIYVIILVDYKFRLSYAKLVLTRLNILKEIFVNNKNAFLNTVNVYLPYDDYYLGSRASGVALMFFAFLVYFFICLGSILCFKSEIYKAIWCGTILFFMTLFFAFFYFKWLDSKKSNIQNNITGITIEIVGSLNRDKNPNSGVDIDSENVDKI